MICHFYFDIILQQSIFYMQKVTVHTYGRSRLFLLAQMQFYHDEILRKSKITGKEQNGSRSAGGVI